MLTIIFFIITRLRRIRNFIQRAVTSLLGAMLVFGSVGCGHVAQPIVKLSAGFANPQIYVPKTGNDVELSLVMKNDGNRSLTVLKVDGGCSCRTVDQHPLPHTLLPGDHFALSVRMSAPRSTSAQNAKFEFETTQGTLSSSIPFLTIVEHEFNPEAASHTSLYDGDKWSFEFTHRRIVRESESQAVQSPRPVPIFPREFSVENMGTHGGKIDGAEGFLFEDKLYRLTLNDSALGLHKASIILPGSDNVSLVETPIVWEHLAFLSSLPKRVALGTQSVRVFLNCPDESIELTKVLSKPLGISALITSPRELKVSLSDAAPTTLDGVISVETTAQGKGPLQIPVVRYSSRK